MEGGPTLQPVTSLAEQFVGFRKGTGLACGT